MSTEGSEGGQEGCGIELTRIRVIAGAANVDQEALMGKIARKPQRMLQ